MRRYKHFGRRKKKRFSRFKLYVNLFFLTLLLFIVFIVTQLDKRIFPSLRSAYEAQAATHINYAINQSMSKVIADKNLTAADFYRNSSDENGKINSLSVNTILITEICNIFAEDVSAQLNDLGNQKITMPLGALLGIQVFSNTGPTYTFSILPIGNALVDYESKFESAGINQINFQVQLNVNATVQIVNPLQNQQVNVTRSLPLVNTIITGETPSTYFKFDNSK